MNLKRTATILVVGGVFAAWLSDAMTPVTRIPESVGASAPRPVDVRGAELANEIARLRDRLRPDATLNAPGRNLFEFKRARVAVVAARPAEVAAPAPLPPAPAFTLKLSGIAEDGVAGAPGSPGTIVRTAMISGAGPLQFVKEGDDVAPHYKVVAISADVVDLRDTTDGTMRHLALR